MVCTAFSCQQFTKPADNMCIEEELLQHSHESSWCGIISASVWTTLTQLHFSVCINNVDIAPFQCLYEQCWHSTVSVCVCVCVCVCEPRWQSIVSVSLWTMLTEHCFTVCMIHADTALLTSQHCCSSLLSPNYNTPSDLVDVYENWSLAVFLLGQVVSDDASLVQCLTTAHQ